MEKLEKKYTIKSHDCDESGRLKMSILISYMMDTMSHLLDPCIKIEHAGWVVVNYQFDINKLPKFDDQITIKIDLCYYNRFFAYIKFLVKDLQENELVTINSQWILFNLLSRRMIELDSAKVGISDAQKIAKLPHFDRIKVLAGQEDFQRSYRVMYSDLDVNHHLTNGRYFDWIVNTIPRDFLNSHSMVAASIQFRKEILYDQSAVVTLTWNADHSVSYHTIKRDEQILTVAKISWVSDK